MNEQQLTEIQEIELWEERIAMEAEYWQVVYESDGQWYIR